MSLSGFDPEGMSTWQRASTGPVCDKRSVLI
jgi:hypothetical protein